MKYVLTFTLLIGLSSLWAQKKLPATEIKTLDGQTVNILDYVGEQPLTILSFWATWCSNCKKELNAIADLYPDWQEDFKLQLIAVTVDDQRSLPKARPVVETSGWEYVILSDTNQKLMNALNFRAIPQTFVLDREGNILYEHTGYAPGAEYDLEDFLRKATKE
jgi:peroxiredoxin